MDGKTKLPRISCELSLGPKLQLPEFCVRSWGRGFDGGSGEEMAEQAGSHHRSLYKQVFSPHWKEAFRQPHHPSPFSLKGCLARMRNSRDRFLNKYRQAGGSMPGRAPSTLLVQEVMVEEWNSFQSMQNYPEELAQLGLSIDLAVLEEIQQELIDEEQSIISEYEKSLQFDEKCLSIMLAEWEANSFICPVCTKYNLRVIGGVVVCQCGLNIPSHSAELTEQKLRACLEASLNDHSAHCPHTPEFSVTDGTEEKPSLLMTCLACDTWSVIL
ncbi:RPA-interacting protein isoform X1 [Heterocephalus glaber]|uniref:RPA-interacting protein isoform X1 n=1 Tax=Heterocephalus glaber TaxID=10181 RepID=A0AAX6PQV6_HETGA|nr:RPA-interacting protein isoform X1 [Heterocephalus glaber]